MGARRFASLIAFWLCLVAGCVFGVCVAPGVASAALGARQFGETGTGSGQLSQPTGVAVDNDPSSLLYGDVYVADKFNRRVDRFSGAGVFELAWGWGVVDGANELQTCTVSCEAGKSEEGGAYNTGAVPQEISGLAVDGDPLSSSFEDVYVVEGGELQRVEKFGPAGEFLLMFGGDVNETTGGDVCVVGEKCKKGTKGSADGQFEELPYTASAIAVGPEGRVYVGDRARVQVFEPTGAWRESISLAGLSGTGDVTALAVNASGDVFVKDSEAAGVREFEPDGTEVAAQFDAGSTSVTAVAVDGSGSVFVGDSNGGFHVLKYAPSGKEIGSFGSETVKLPLTSGTNSKGNLESGSSSGMAFSEATDELYVPEFYEEDSPGTAIYIRNNDVWALTVPPPGPFIAAASVTPGPRSGDAVFEGKINPEGNQTEYHFEYVTDTEFGASGYAHALSTPVGSLAASLESRSVSADVAGLSPSTIYHYRIVATNSESVTPTTSQDQTFESLPPASIDTEYVVDVASTSATVDASVDPLGVSTEYCIEYGTSTAYGHTVTGDAGEGTEAELVGVHLQELQASTTYHYRIVLHNEIGTVEGADRLFTTQAVGGELTLPDGRAWELVSPPNKKGALIETFATGASDAEIQAANDGSGITYISKGPSVGEDPEGNGLVSQVLSVRVPGGWSSQDLTVRAPRISEAGEEGALGVNEFRSLYPLFSQNLSLAVVEPPGLLSPLLSPEATEDTLYLRDDSNGGFTPLVDAGNVPAGTRFGPLSGSVTQAAEETYFLAATPDLGHVVFRSPFALTENAVTEELYVSTGGSEQWNLYEWSEGRLQLVNILPDGETTRGVEPGVRLGGGSSQEGDPSGFVPRAISNDGQRIAWDWGEPYIGRKFNGLFVRDMVEERTVKVGGSHAIFQTMNADGSEIFFLENGDLYVYNFETGIQTNLTADHGAGESSGGVLQSVSDVSEGGSYVYFVATGVLGNANGAVSGSDNLYLAHDDGGEWSTTYIATLSSDDEADWYATGGAKGAPELAGVSSRVSPNGRYLAFMSERSLTGYDNIDAVSGQPDEEVYLYDADTEHLVCASCDPTGARPVGVHDVLNAESLLVDRNGTWNTKHNGIGGIADDGIDHWLAGSIPSWVPGHTETKYQPRFLSDSGRLFFDSPDALVPQATNGLEDVYEYEPEGVGGCTVALGTFSERSGGCVNLISAGTSSSESAFLDASENGDDVFFITTSKLVAADYDNGYDVYDAHVCSTEVPCVSEPVSPPPCDSGDSCKAAPSPQPEIFGPTPSATFSGVGNVVEEAKAGKAKAKPKKKKAKKKKAKKKKRKVKVGRKSRAVRARRSGAGVASGKGSR